MRWLIGAVAAFAAVFLATSPLPWPARAGTALLVGAAPVAFLAQARLAAIPGVLPPRRAIYLSSAIGIWTLAALAAAAGLLSGITPRMMGLSLPSPATVLAWSAAVTLAALAALVAGRVLRLPENAVLRHVLPRTAGEKGWFTLLAFSAGIGEELAYRAFLIPALAVVVGSAWVAAGITSAVFGLSHIYQGATGVARATALGFALAIPFVVTGSVVPAMVAHTAIDLISGLWLSDWWLREPPDAGGSTAP